MGSYSIEVKAHAIALFQAGYGRDTVRRKLLEELGEAPAEQTLSDWRNAAALSGLLRTQSEELAARAAVLTHRAFDALEELPNDKLIKHVGALNFVRGTNIDKLQREAAGNQGNAITFVVLSADHQTAESELPTIETEFAEVQSPLNLVPPGKADHPT